MNLPSHLFVFDIETIPDAAASHNLTDCTSTEISEQRKSLVDYHLAITDGKNDFLRQPFHKVIAISGALFTITHTDNNQEIYILDRFKSFDEPTAIVDELSLLTSFFKCLNAITNNRNTARLVTFNGKNFDIPVLKYRAMKYGISCQSFYDKSNKGIYQYRYNTDYNCDLLEVLSDFGSSARVKLHEVCAIFGFPGKFGIDGKDVAPLYDDGKIESIRQYCETDVLNTYLVYLRYSLHIGRINKDTYNRSVDQLLEHIDTVKDQHLIDFKQAWFNASNNEVKL